MKIAENCEAISKSVNSIKVVNSVSNDDSHDIELDSDSVLANVLTEGGMDGTLDKANIKVSETKELDTSKGKIVVGAQLSDKMSAIFKQFIENYKGDVFDNTTLGKTKQVCNPELKPDAKAHS